MFTLAIALVASLVAPRDPRVPSHTSAPDTVRVVLVVDDTAARRSLVRGAMLGAEEAAHTGALFGTAVALRVVTRSGLDSMARASATASHGTAVPSLYLVAGDSAVCSEVVSQSTRTSSPVLDAGCPVADGAPAGTVYSLYPAPYPATTPAPAAGDTVRVELWHRTLDKFGGEQLNERFRRRFSSAMDSPAWVGWLSMKIALDLALHAHASSGAALLRQLADPRTQFDGQKGRPLRFSPETHRLVQPVYRVAGRGEGERVVAEVAP